MIALLAQLATDAPQAAEPALSAVARGQIGAVLVLAGIVLVPLVALLVNALFQGRNVVFARHGFSHVVQVTFAIAAVAFASSFVGPPTGEDVLADLVRTVVAFGAGVAVVFVTAVRFDPDGWRSVGMWRGRHASASVAGVLAYVLLLPALLGVAMVWTYVLELFGQPVEAQAVVQAFAEMPRERMPLAIVLAVIVQPLFEEILFRAFLQPLLVQNVREKAGIALTSFVFAALHGPTVFLPIFALSLLLGAVMLRTQRLAAVFAIHALHNGLQIALLPFVSKIGESKPALFSWLF